MRRPNLSDERDCLDALARAMLPAGHGLPGAAEVGVADALVERSSWWHPAVRERVRWLVRAWDLAPLFTRRHTRFVRMSTTDQRRWLEDAYHSRWTARRLHVSALKQLLFLEWGSTPAVEDALGFDYHCRRDDEVHGANRPITSGSATRKGDEPSDYQRPGPAVGSGAIPERLLTVRGFHSNANGRLETRAWPDMEDGVHERADVVVIGSGAGGAVAAATLAERGVDVVVLEEGPQVSADTDFSGPLFDRFQRFCRDNGTTQVLGHPPIPMPLGRVVGGTTVINSGTCFRAPDRVLHRWAVEHGVRDATLDVMTPYYEEIEDFLNVRPVPWQVLGPNGEIAHRAAVALGYSGGPLLRNISDCHGCGQCVFGCPTDAKQAMHISYLPRAQRAGARIYAGVKVTRILLDDRRRATGVEAVLLDRSGRRRGRITFDARQVVVCAGAIHTPGLLTTSRVPDPARQTGRNLRIHPATGVGGFFSEDVFNWKGTLQSYYIDEFFDSHELMFEATTTTPGVGAGSLPGIGERAMRELADFPKLATLGFYVSDTSRGRVFTLPSGQVVPTYRLNALDTRRMALGIALAAEMLLAAGATRVYPGIPGLDSISARADIAQIKERALKPAHLKLTAFHPMGTVRMGSDRALSSVDSYGRHHVIDNLWVEDASLFPSCVGVNPQMTIMAFAKRGAEALASIL